MPLIDLCKNANYRLAPEKQELAKRAQHKEEFGNNYRPKIGVRGAHRDVLQRQKVLFSKNPVDDYKRYITNMLVDVFDGG